MVGKVYFFDKQLAEGDMRRAVMYLQNLSQLHDQTHVTPQSVYEISGSIPTQVVKNLYAKWSLNDFSGCEENIKEIVRNGYSASQLLLQVYKIFNKKYSFKVLLLKIWGYRPNKKQKCLLNYQKLIKSWSMALMNIYNC